MFVPHGCGVRVGFGLSCLLGVWSSVCVRARWHCAWFVCGVGVYVMVVSCVWEALTRMQCCVLLCVFVVFENCIVDASIFLYFL